jgi:UDP-N-acetylglucosamine 2-epimerase (non-hydrolysing)
VKLPSHSATSALVLQPIIFVVGARPNFVKIAPLLRAMSAHDSSVASYLVHTGQHYDKNMNDQFFSDLNLPAPNINLNVGSGSHATQTADIMKRFEPVVDDLNPSCVVVVGDVNSTLACALVAVKKGVPVAHVEAGLRSYDRSMPEEINRILTDQISDRLYTTERSAISNLMREAIPKERVMFAGNVMIDSVQFNRSSTRSTELILAVAGIDPELFMRVAGYGLVTLHRPSNVDDPTVLAKLMAVLLEVSKSLPLILVLHPRTQSQLVRFGLLALIDSDRMVVLPPQGYLDMLGLLGSAKVVLTDSGGLQEETTALGVPCLTLRNSTERPITLEQGTNTLVGLDRELILSNLVAVLRGEGKKGCMPELWDGCAAERIATDLFQWLSQATPRTVTA